MAAEENDEKWADLARMSMAALDAIGYHPELHCMPGDTKPCGGTFAQHAMANLATLKACADHHLTHLHPGFATVQEIYSDQMELIRHHCRWAH